MQCTLDILREKIEESESHGTVLIAKGNKIILDMNLKNASNSQYRIHSMTKPITGLAVIILIERGYIKLNTTLASIGGILKCLPFSDKINIRHLLNHGSGIFDVVNHIVYDHKPEYVFDTWFDGNELEMPDIGTYINEICSHKPSFEPGQHEGPKYYNNTGYDILGYIIYTITGMKTTDFIKQNIFDPLDMTMSTFHDKDNSNELAPLESFDKEGVKEQYPFFGANTFVVSTTRDYLKFITQYKNLINKKSLRTYHGLYYFTELEDGEILFHHNGGGDFTHEFAEKGIKSPPLSRSYFMHFMNTKFTVILFQNFHGKNNPLIEYDYCSDSNIIKLIFNFIKSQ